MQYLGGGEGSAQETPNLLLDNDMLLAACENFYRLNDDAEYRFDFPENGSNIVFTQVRKFYWIAAIATRRARSAAGDFEQNGRRDVDFTRILRHLDIAIACQDRGKEGLAAALNLEIQQAPDEPTRRNWRRASQVLWGAPTNKRRRVSSYAAHRSH